MPDPLGEMDSSLSVKLLVSKCISSQQTFVSLFIHLYLFYYVDKKQECCYESWFVFMYWQPSITWSKILNVMSFSKFFIVSNTNAKEKKCWYWWTWHWSVHLLLKIKIKYVIAFYCRICWQKTCSFTLAYNDWLCMLFSFYIHYYNTNKYQLI